MEIYGLSHEYSPPGFGRNLSSGSGISSDSSKNLSSKFVHYTTDFPPGFGSNVPGFGRVDLGKGSKSGRSFYWRRSAGAVKSKLGMGGECDRIIVKKDSKEMTGKDFIWDDGGEREKAVEILRLFRKRCDEISRRGEDIRRIDCKAMKELTNEGKIIKGFSSKIGAVPGVEVGDKFDYRVEMVIVGLHRRYEHGIDYMLNAGKKLATCIVATEGHLDRMRHPNVLTYIGEGGKSRCSKSGTFNGQECRGGNLALLNSMKLKSPVRVVKGFKRDVYGRVHDRVVQKIKYIYDGLYEVTNYEQKKGPLGNMVFEFKLLRFPGQPSIPWNENCKRNRF